MEIERIFLMVKLKEVQVGDVVRIDLRFKPVFVMSKEWTTRHRNTRIRLRTRPLIPGEGAEEWSDEGDPEQDVILIHRPLPFGTTGVDIRDRIVKLGKVLPAAAELGSEVFESHLGHLRVAIAESDLSKSPK